MFLQNAKFSFIVMCIGEGIFILIKTTIRKTVQAIGETGVCFSTFLIYPNTGRAQCVVRKHAPSLNLNFVTILSSKDGIYLQKQSHH